MKRERIALTWVYIIVFNILFLNGCKDIVFNNPLDPNATKEAVKVIQVLDTSLRGEGDIAFDGEKFWKTGPSSELIAFDRESGLIIREVTATSATGVTFFNNLIYLCDGKSDNILYAVDPLSGDIINRISTRDIYPAFITTSGGKLIIYDYRSSGIVEYDLESGNSKHLFSAPGLNIGGIESYKSGLLISDMNTDSIYYFSMSGDVIKVFSSPASGISGIGVDSSSYIFLLMLDGKVYKVSLP